ncbi:MAG TPA: hypothetical protein V6C71_24375 [Coleofasciculaceae cyanobacterium]|jgi:hypothetical protein
MNFNKLFTKSAFLLLLTVSLAVGDTKANANTGVDASDRTDSNGAVEDDTLAQTEAEENVTTEELSENPEDLIGQTVTIRSDALKTIEPSTFTVSDEEFFGGEDIVVVNASGEPFVLPEGGTEVQVTGEVTRFVSADIESAYDLDLDPDLYVDYTDRPAIIAETLAPAPDPGEITKNPTQYYGQTLAVTGEVEEIYGANTFTLDEDELFGANDLLVLVTNPSETVSEDEAVAVTGELRSFVVADLERDYDLTWDLDVQQEIEAEYSNRPVLVVDRVYPSAIPSAAK